MNPTENRFKFAYKYKGATLDGATSFINPIYKSIDPSMKYVPS